MTLTSPCSYGSDQGDGIGGSFLRRANPTPAFWSLLLLTLTVSVRPALAQLVDLYSENAWSLREDQAVSSLRLRTERPDVLFLPFLTAGTELYTAGLGDYHLDPLSYFYGGGGLRLGNGPLSLRSELRFRKRFNESPFTAFSTIDWRTTLVAGDVRVRELARNIALFIEPYSETVLTSADAFNVIETAYVRGGLRYRLLPYTELDLLVEPWASVDTQRHFYYNAANLKTGLRLQRGLGLFNLQLFATYVWQTYFARGDAELNPLAQRSEGFRALLVLGGYF